MRPSSMTGRYSLTLLVLLWNLGSVRSLAAQDLVITNARIIVGQRHRDHQGSIVVRGGRIVSVSAGPRKRFPASRPSMGGA